MSDPVTVVLSGNPQGKGRARAYRVGNFIKHYTPEKTRTYEGMIRTAAMDVMGDRPPISDAIEFDLCAVFSIPQSWPDKKQLRAMSGELKPTKKPDADNILKTWADAMNGVVFVDDCQIVKATLRKCYGDRPGVTVTVRRAA